MRLITARVLSPYLNAIKMATRQNSKVSRELRQLPNQPIP
jgi:hypothetical protein